jgi:hypothetical protein
MKKQLGQIVLFTMILLGATLYKTMRIVNSMKQ